jgi:hypothetical protein
LRWLRVARLSHGGGTSGRADAWGRRGRQLFLADQTNSRYAIQIPKKPPIMKNTTDEIESCPAPERLGMKLPINPPTNPPMYVGPLRTNPSSVNSTAETMNCSEYGQTGGRPCRPSRESGGAGSRSQPACALVPIVKAGAVRGYRLPGTVAGAIQEPEANAPETEDQLALQLIVDRVPGAPHIPHCDFRTQRLAVVVIARPSLRPLSADAECPAAAVRTIAISTRRVASR